jgi:uncharacterized protein (UPF0333 family)
MIVKLLLLAIIILLIYIIFFQKKDQKIETKTKNDSKNSMNELVACDNCNTFVSANEIIRENNHNFCSIQCKNSFRG